MKRLFLVLGLVMVPTLASPVFAGDDTKTTKKPNATKALKKVVKAFSKQKNYGIKLDVRGGFSQTADHNIPMPTVNRSYKADYYRAILRVAEPQVIRSRNAGAIRSAGSWKQLLAVNDGQLVDRLFSYPDQVIADAIVKGSKVSWKEGTKKLERSGSGRTAVTKEVEVTPNILVVEVPTKVATKRYTTIQNSGCTSEG